MPPSQRESSQADRALNVLIPQELRERIEESGRWKIRVISYRLGDKYHCTADNVDPGNVLARAVGQTRNEAEAKAIEESRALLDQTRVLT